MTISSDGKTVTYERRPGQHCLQSGDIVALDGGPCEVVRSSESAAVCQPVLKRKVQVTKRVTGETAEFAKGAPVKRCAQWVPANLVLFRAGQHGRDEFLAECRKEEQKNMNHNSSLVTLEPGDALCYHNEVCCVVRVDDRHAWIGSLEGWERREPRQMNEFLFDFTACGKPRCTVKDRLTPEKRAEFLKTFLVQRKPAEAKKQSPGAGEPQPAGAVSGETENQQAESESSMAKRVRKKKSVAADASPATNGMRSKGSLGQLFGASVVRCVVAAGKAGATYEQVQRVLKAHKIEAKESTVKQNLRLGKTGKLAGADLTKEQLAEFLA